MTMTEYTDKKTTSSSPKDPPKTKTGSLTILYDPDKWTMDLETGSAMGGEQGAAPAPVGPHWTALTGIHPVDKLPMLEDDPEPVVAATSGDKVQKLYSNALIAKAVKKKMVLARQFGADYKISDTSLVTKKAQGVFLLSKNPSILAAFEVKVPKRAELSIWPAGGRFRFPAFARPCPTKPRHGFVDSRVIYSPFDALAVIIETLMQDINGEVIFMPVLTGAFSAVATHKGVDWGRGNDGVTGGKGSTKHIPCHLPPTNWNSAICDNKPELKSLLNDTDQQTVYLELVEDKGTTTAVQVRGGPKLPVSADFVPKAFTFEAGNTLAASPDIDLLDWEEQVAKAKPDTVAVLNEDMSLSSHHAIHCVLKKMPVLSWETYLRLKSGDKVKKVEGTKVPAPSKKQMQRLAALLVAELRFRMAPGDFNRTIGSHGRAVSAVAGIHAMALWPWNEHLLRLRAYCIANAFNLCFAACVGEMRHYNAVGPGKDTDAAPAQKPDTDLSAWLTEAESKVFWLDYSESVKKLNRAGAYDLTPRIPFSGKITALDSFVVDFSKDWKSHGAGYGGGNWVNVAAKTGDMGRCCLKFLKSPTFARFKELLDAYNTAINTVHNGGRVLNKWVEKDMMTKLAKTPSLGFLHAEAGAVVLGVDHLYATGQHVLWPPIRGNYRANVLRPSWAAAWEEVVQDMYVKEPDVLY